MAYTLNEIKQTHPNWPSLSRYYDYLFRSYLGGKEFRDGAYLRKYLNEDSGPGNQYAMRLINTPLYNYCKNTVDVYRSFLFRVPPTRTMAGMQEDPSIQSFLKDADRDGRTLDAFMRLVSDRLQIFGSIWVMVDRPDYQAQSRLEEITMDIRPYVTAYNPSAILDWSYSSKPSGESQLDYIKVVEESTAQYDVIKIWTPETVTRLVVSKLAYTVQNSTDSLEAGNTLGLVESYDKIQSQEEFVNPLGYIPFINVITEPGLVKGTGVSFISDVADISRSIYNKLSSLEQTIRISGHPTLVKTTDTEAAAGAGAIITMPDNLPGDLKPFLLQPSSSSVDGILRAIEADVKAINEVTHLGAVRATTGSPMSGVALQTEFQMLNSKLADVAITLEEAEDKIWKLYFDWQDQAIPEDFSVVYEKSFDLRDKHADLELYRKTLEVVTPRGLPDFESKIMEQVAELVLLTDEDIEEVKQEIEAKEYTSGTEAAEVSMPTEPEMSMPHSAPEGLTSREAATYEAQERFVQQYGKYPQAEAHYVGAEENPFIDSGMICGNCVYWEQGQCDIVQGQIETNAICKLWIIPANLLTNNG
jgi:hypothetical protein